MKRLFTYLTLITILGNLSAEIAVKSFRKLESDMTARIDAPKKDQNGDVCAIIKVVTTQTGFSWEPDGLGIVAAVPKVGEYWLYVPYGAKRMTIKHAHLGILRDYLYNMPIERACVYEMVLTTGKVITTVDETIPTKFVIITSTPSGADVFINDQHKGQTPFQEEMIDGEYTYRIAKDFFRPRAGKFNLSSDKDNEQLDFKLDPNFGFAEITSKPEDGMSVSINGKMLNQLTPLKTDTLISGKYSISVSKALFHTQNKEITINDNQITPIEVVLLPAFGSINLDTKPESAASISLNGKQIGKTTPCTLRLESGDHTITFRKEFFEPKTIKIKIEDGKDIKQTVELLPIFGTVQLNSDSASALFVDNQFKGKSRWEGRLVGGFHTFEAKKDKHHTAIEKLEVEIGSSKQISLDPQPIFGKLKIVTNAIGTTVKLNDKEFGTTPRLISDLLIGEYRMTLEKEGYRKISRKIIIEEGKTTEVKDTLLNGMKVDIQSSPIGAQVFVDNKEIGKTPFTCVLDIGSHKLKLINGKKIVDETITVSENSSNTFNYDVNEVVIVAFKSNLTRAKIGIDGRTIGEMPLTTKLNIGTHIVKIERRNMALEKKITVRSDGKNEFNFSNRDFIRSFYKKHPVSVSYGYHQTNFANTTFAERIANASITNDYGHAATISINLFPLEITAGAFSSTFKTHNLAPFKDNAAIKHRGIELCMNLTPINIGSGLFPYIGGGYQLSQIYSAAESMTINGEAYTDTSMPVAKGGLKVKIGKLFLFGEYKKTFPLKGSSYNSQQLSAGLGLTF